MIQAQGQFYQPSTPEVIYTVLSIYPNPEYDGGCIWYSCSDDPTQAFMSMKEFKQSLDNGKFKIV